MLVEESEAPYTQRVQALAKQYDNLGLIACQRALNNLKEDKGIELDLVPEASVVESALNQVSQATLATKPPSMPASTPAQVARR